MNNNDKQVRHYLNEETGMIEEIEIVDEVVYPLSHKVPDERPTPMGSDTYRPKSVPESPIPLVQSSTERK